MLGTIRQWVRAHKIISLIIVIVAAGGGYYWYSSAQTTATVTKYVIQDASQGTVVSSISESGQVQSVTSLDVKAQVSETVDQIYVKVGDHVAAGQALMQLDTTNEQKAVTQAQISLQSAQISLAKLQEIPTTTLLSDQNSVVTDQANLLNASATLAKDYQNSFDSLSSQFVDFQNNMAGLRSFVSGNDINKAQTDPDAYIGLMPTDLQPGAAPLRDAIESDYAAAVTAYAQSLADYSAASSTESMATLDALFADTHQTALTINNAIKDVKGLLDYVTNNYPKNVGLVQLPPITTTFQTEFATYGSTASGDVTSLGGTISTIANDKNSLNSAQLSLNEASTSLAQFVAGPDPLDVQSQQLSIQNAQLSLQTAEQNFGYDTVRAPIAGVISAIPSVVGEAVASPAVSMVAEGKLAQVTVNEVDAAKVALGDKATLTFDALPDLSLAGQVTEMDAVGTVSQGVVSYNVQISFAEASGTNEVLPGMSVTANIVTAVDQNVIAVPNAAVVTQGTTSYVLEPATPVSSSTLAASANGGVILPAVTRVPVTVGLANDTETEIKSGVNVGDQIIVQTIQSAATASTAATGGTSALRLGGGAGALFGGSGGFGGGAAGGARTTGGAARTTGG